MISAAMDSGLVDRLYRPPPKKSRPSAMCVARCEPYVTTVFEAWHTRERRHRHIRSTSTFPVPAIIYTAETESVHAQPKPDTANIVRN